jgi:uncharacterized protein YbcI
MSAPRQVQQSEDPQSHGPLLAEISNAVMRTTADYTGRGPTRSRTVMAGDWIFVTLSDTLTKGERRLAENGRADLVREARHAFQQVMRDDLVLEIERLTGRRVSAFLSDNHIDPDVAIEVFKLQPQAATTTGQPADSETELGCGAWVR